MYDSNNFLSNKIIDHNVLHHFVETKCPKSGFHLYSLNIAQISDLRTMVIFNKINKYLKTFESEEYIKKKDNWEQNTTKNIMRSIGCHRLRSDTNKIGYWGYDDTSNVWKCLEKDKPGNF